MKSLMRLFAGLSAVTMMMSASVSCGSNDGGSGGTASSSSSEANEHYKEQDEYGLDVDESEAEELKGDMPLT